MDEYEFDRRLAAGDPARATPILLDSIVDDLAERPSVRVRRRPRRAAAIVGAAVLVVGGLAAFSDLDAYLLSVPPLSALDDQTRRTVDGLPYVPVTGSDGGEQCEIWVDFGGITSNELALVNDYWSEASPQTFAENVSERLQAPPIDETAESLAKRDQLLEDFASILPGVAWGAAPPDRPWEEGEPHITSFSTFCADDLEAQE